MDFYYFFYKFDVQNLIIYKSTVNAHLVYPGTLYEQSMWYYMTFTYNIPLFFNKYRGMILNSDPDTLNARLKYVLCMKK